MKLVKICRYLALNYFTPGFIPNTSLQIIFANTLQILSLGNSFTQRWVKYQQSKLLGNM